MRNLNCLITGATGGIGRSLSIELSKFVKHIYIVARNVNKLESLHDEILSNGSDCTIVPIDLCLDNVIENLSKEIFIKDNHLDILVLSAGQIFELSPIGSIDIDKANDILKLNYLANLRFLKSFHPLLLNSKTGSVAVISSENSVSKKEYWGIYQPIMSALNELTLIYARENRNNKIKTNIFFPDAVDTNLRDVIMPGEDKENILSPKKVAKKIVSKILTNNKNANVIKI